MTARAMTARATIRRLAAVVAATAGLGACGHVDRYEAAVYDEDPNYCYRSLAGIECFSEPYHRADKRLVSYVGPHPSRYDAPEPPATPELKAPAPVNYWVKDPEPIPRPAPVNYRVGSLPWLERPITPSPLASPTASPDAPIPRPAQPQAAMPETASPDGTRAVAAADGPTPAPAPTYAGRDIPVAPLRQRPDIPFWPPQPSATPTGPAGDVSTVPAAPQGGYVAEDGTGGPFLVMPGGS